jgi:hypothetical protein
MYTIQHKKGVGNYTLSYMTVQPQGYIHQHPPNIVDNSEFIFADVTEDISGCI